MNTAVKEETPPSEEATFELRILISLINKHKVVGTTEEELREVVTHVCGKNPETEEEYKELTLTVVDHIIDNHPDVARAADLTYSGNLDRDRYLKMLNLFKRYYKLKRISK